MYTWPGRKYFLRLLSPVFVCALFLCFFSQNIPGAEFGIQDVYKLIDDKEYDEAIEKAKILNRENPDDIETYIVLANAYLNKGRLNAHEEDDGQAEQDQAGAEAQEEAAAYDPELVDLSIETLERGLAVDPERADVYLGICFVAQKGGRHQKLIETIGRTLEAVGDSEDIAGVLSAYGNNYYEDKQFDKAADVYRAVVTALPDNGKSLSNLGLMEVLSGNFEAGIAHLKEAGSLAPDHSFAWNNLVLAYSFTGEFELAAAAVQNLFEAASPETWNYFQRAMIFLNVDREKALDYLNEYLACEKENEDDKRMALAAESIMDMLMGMSVPDEELNAILGDMFEIKETVGILAFTNFLIHEKSGYVPALVIRSDVYDAFEFHELAAADAVEGLGVYDRAPNDFLYVSRDRLIMNLCRAYYRQGLYGRAAEELLAIQNVEVYAFSIAVIHEDAGDYEKAFHYFSIAARNVEDDAAQLAKEKLKQDVYKEYQSR